MLKFTRFFLFLALVLIFLKPAWVYSSTACPSGNYSGCGLCNSMGTAWINDNSKCGAGQVCQNWTCISSASKVKNKIDTANCNVISGWICDPNNSGTPYWVEFYLDETNKNNPDGYIGFVNANSPRSDIAGQCGGATGHGFSFTIPAKTANLSRVIADGNAHSIHVIGRKDANDWVIFDESPKTLQCAASQASQNNITVTASPSGVTEKSIGANEGDSGFNINDLKDLGVSNYRIYLGTFKHPWDDKNIVWGSQSIDQIKANPDLIDWSTWDTALNNGGWRKSGVSLYGMLSALKANNIAPALNLELYWRDVPGLTPPKTQADFNEVWKYAFATVYYMNVKNNFNVNDWSVAGEPESYDVGHGTVWAGTLSDYLKYSQVCHDAIKYVYDKYLPGRTFRYEDPVSSNVDDGWPQTSIQQNCGIIDAIDWHNYGYNQPDDAKKIRAWIGNYCSGSRELYLSEWGATYFTGMYSDRTNAMSIAKILMQHSLVDGSYIDRSSIFSLYDWGTPGTGALLGTGGYGEGLVSGSAKTKTPSYYTFRMVTRAFQGAKTKYILSGVPQDSGLTVGATKDAANLYLTLLNSGTNSYNFSFDVSAHGTGASYTIRKYSSSFSDEVTGGGTLSNGKLTLASEPGTITQAIIAVGSYACTPYVVNGCNACRSDGSGWVNDVSQCAAGQTCTGGTCATTCAPKTCASLNYNCGSVSDGCGKTLDCGSCGTNQTCSGGQCSINTTCVAKTCAGLGYNCGKTGDGCGATLDCGTCSSGQTCTSGQCIAGQTCVPKTCNLLGYNCGKTGDGCGAMLDCGSCGANFTCSGNACLASNDQVSQTPDNSDTSLVGLYAQIEYLQNEIIRVTNLIKARNSSAALPCSSINYNLSYGMKNDPQVKCLQQFLKSQGFLTSSPTGNYYTLTKNAVAAFQSRYADDLLVPLGLNHGSGNVDNATRAKINQLIGGTK